MTKDQLIDKAKTFGIDTEGLTVEQLKAAIKKVKAEKIAELTVAVTEAKTAFENLPEDASDEDKIAVQGNINLAEQALADFTGVPTETKEEENEAEFDFNGSTYGFKKTAPARFNFLGVNRSQEEWIQDKDAMELLISGNSSFVKLLKK
ncbi:hypothetical protein [Flavobacterium sp. 14A]|uniref:hypothetical protein n=1 Tax=Flavobacterium sp. 14A TaxID=2735896 RepID=UPI00156E0617|nr:hypothetical protein [Flavobacterium sp. 14A]NRT11519.1 hypothetical protein [Flavobacterium sp. 14A]